MNYIANLRRQRKRQAPSESLALHYGDSQTAIAHLVPDDEWPDMWRVAWPDGSQSDIVNLSRAKNAAAVIAGRSLFRWSREPVRWPLVQKSRPSHAEVADDWIERPAAPGHARSCHE